MSLLARQRIRKARQAMEAAFTYTEWLDAAKEVDRLEGNAAWREDPSSLLYDYELIAEHLRLIREYRQTHNLRGLRQLIEESLHRNLGDLSNQALYAAAHAGTKRLIEAYLDEVERIFDWLCDTPLPGYPDTVKLALVKAALRVFGRSALILSGGGALGLYHLGVAKALWEHDLLPDILSGASMGAIVAGGVCSRDDSVVHQLWEEPERIHRRAVRINRPGQALRQGSLLAPEQLHEHVTANLGDMTFREAYKHSGRVLNIAVSPTRHRQNPRLLNPITSPHVLIASAASASCALPALFPPAQLRHRDRGGRVLPYMGDEYWIDGSIHGDVPAMQLSRLYNVNHYIVSQANPHIIPFSKLELSTGVVPAAVDIATSGIRAQTRQTLGLARRRVGRSLWRQPLEWAHALTHQTYTGDINIYPNLDPSTLVRVMKNPTLDELKGFILRGERATWPRLAMIRDQTRLSRSMLRCIARLEQRIAEGAKARPEG